MPTVFWDSEDPLCEHYQQVQHIYGITVTRVGYLDIATREEEIQSVILLYDNA